MDREYTVNINGDAVTFGFKDCLIHAEGNDAGNIDAIITTSPPLPQASLLDELVIRLPGSDEFLYIYGYGVVENSLKATFNSSTKVDKQNLPESVEVFWGENGEQFIGEINCQPYSEKAEHDLSDEIIDHEEEVAEEPEPAPADKPTKDVKSEKGKAEISGSQKSPSKAIYVVACVFALVMLIVIAVTII